METWQNKSTHSAINHRIGVLSNVTWDTVAIINIVGKGSLAFSVMNGKKLIENFYFI